MIYDIVFGAATLFAVASALGVVLSGNPFYSALSLLANLASLATFYLLLQADFLAAAQVLVYAGAVMIMFLFVVAYLGGRAHEPTRDRPVWQTLAAVVAAVAITAEVIVAVTSQSLARGPSVTPAFGSAATVGQAFLSRYLLAFEATSILLLIAAVGGVVLGSRRPDARDWTGPEDFVEPERARRFELMASVMDRQTHFGVTRVPRPRDEGEPAEPQETPAGGRS